MGKNLICTSIVECFPYPFVFVNAGHSISRMFALPIKTVFSPASAAS